MRWRWKRRLRHANPLALHPIAELEATQIPCLLSNNQPTQTYCQRLWNEWPTPEIG